MGNFWTCGAPLGAVRIVFRCRVQEAAVSGLTAHHLSAADHEKIDTVIARLGRTVLLGDACNKTEEVDAGTGEVTVKYKPMTDKEVRAKLKLVDTALEVDIRRIKWMQTLSADPKHNKQVLTALFGQLPIEEHPTVDEEGRLTESANPTARLFEKALQRMSSTEEGAIIRATQD